MPMDGARQLERASRLLDIGSSAPRGMRTPVRKSLDQLFGEARVRLQPESAPSTTPFGPTPFGPAGASRVLQAPQAQRLDREVANFSLSSQAGAGAGGSGLAGDVPPEDQPNLGVREFFAMRHERVLLCAVEEAHRDCMRSFERQSVERLQGDWEDAKAQIMNSLAPQRLGPAAVSSALRDRNEGIAAAVAPPQDAAIVTAILREPLSQASVQSIARLSCESCPAYQGELAECWSIVSHSIHPTARAVVCGSLAYLQQRFAEEVRSAVYRSADARLGGLPDAWSIVRAFGRVKFETASFPSATAHVWYAAYIAARAGLGQLLLELPERAAPCSDRCPVLRTVCVKMARRIQATAPPGQPLVFEAVGNMDEADLLRADLADEGNSFHDVLVSLLLGRGFAFGRLPEGTVEDWLWFRLHALFIAGGDGDTSPAFMQHLESLQQHTLALPPSHYDPTATGGLAVSGPAAAGVQPSGSAGPSAGGATVAASVTQTLNFTKVLLLTAQFGRAVQQLRLQDRSLRGPALHLALVLRRAGTLQATEPSGQGLDVTALVCDYAGRFSCSDQLQYFRVLDLPDRVEALQGLLLRGGVGTNDELLGYIDANGRHRPGLLEQSLHDDGMGDRAEFVDLCARAGRVACERGQYREAIRLFHLGRCHSEVLQVLCRCLRLPMWQEPAAAAAQETALLGQDLQRFFSIYERNLDRYALSSHAWAVARKLYAARMFHMLCSQGRPEAALDVFDREQLLPLATEYGLGTGVDSEVLAECPGVVGDYVRILHHASSQGAVNSVALRARVRQLQSFLAVHSHRLTLDQQTIAALASLALC